MSRLKVYNLATGQYEYVGGISTAALAVDPTFTTALAANPAIPLGRRNMIHNGQVPVNQRQLSSVALAGGVAQFLADRWAIYNGGVGAANLLWNAFGPFNVPIPAGRPRPAFIEYIQVTTAEAAGAIAAADFMQWTQTFEGIQLQHLGWGTANALPVTYSFDIHSTIATTYVVELFRNETGQRTIAKAITVPAGFSTQAVTFPGDVTTLTSADFGARLNATVFVAAGSNLTSGGSLQTAWGAVTNNKRAFGVSNNFNATVGNVFAIVNAQLEVGLVATPYEIQPFPDVLSDCQRYYEKSYDYATAIGANTGSAAGLAQAWAFDNTALTRLVVWNAQFKVPKRAAPAVTMWADDGTVGYVSLYNNPAGKLQIAVYPSASERGIGNSFMTMVAAATQQTMYQCHWAVSAEL